MSSKPLKLTGDTVVISKVADHRIGRGEFRLLNPGTAIAKVQVVGAWLQIGEEVSTMSPLHFFPKGATESVPASQFKVAAGDELSFSISFPPVPVNAAGSDPCSVRLQLQADGQELNASSPVNLVRRIPRR